MDIKIYGEFIKLGQFLKKIKIIDSGAEAKEFILNHKITINNKKPEGRNSKIYVGSIVWIDDEIFKIESEN
ncbi:RNA-binding S4 domain-containing protein [Mesomycoplasma neurolyticum]|uniref:S4-like RNA-binding protein n=1 Tax=Mesomycoplasma neurolyticum TaxID=2120 RepID=A0A449A5Y1_9BACT|nr:RNA-binding S4 domain-containing protein [Mesomycoplasma neurolyticum]VEU59661.1 s4-like RNA-binding protein [Mesomycoplasma neurolyticum]